MKKSKGQVFFDWKFVGWLSLSFIVFIAIMSTIERHSDKEHLSTPTYTETLRDKPDPRYPIGYGKATTMVDGYDVGHVNLWSSPDDSRYKVAELKNGEDVDIMMEDDPIYIKVRTKDGIIGWCREEFISGSR